MSTHGLLRRTGSVQAERFLNPLAGPVQSFGFRNRFAMSTSMARMGRQSFFGNVTRFNTDRVLPHLYRNLGMVGWRNARQFSIDKHHLEHVDWEVANHLVWRAVKTPVDTQTPEYAHEARRPAMDGLDDETAPLVDQHRQFATPGLYRWPRALLQEQTNLAQLARDGFWVDPENDLDDLNALRVEPLLPLAVPSRQMYVTGAWPFALRSFSRNTQKRADRLSYNAWLLEKMVPLVHERGLQYTAHAKPRLLRAVQTTNVDESGTMAPGTKIASTDPRWGRHNTKAWAHPWTSRRHTLFEPARAIR